MYYKASTRYFPVPLNVNPLEFRTTIFEGTSMGTASISDGYQYFSNDPLVEVMNYKMISHLWGDPLAFPTIGYTQLENTWGTVSIPSMRLRWDLYTCGSDGSNPSFIGEVITPLRDTAAYNTR